MKRSCIILTCGYFPCESYVTTIFRQLLWISPCGFYLLVYYHKTSAKWRVCCYSWRRRGSTLGSKPTIWGGLKKQKPCNLTQLLYRWCSIQARNHERIAISLGATLFFLIQVVERILFIYAKLNPGTSYVQVWFYKSLLQPLSNLWTRDLQLWRMADVNLTRIRTKKIIKGPKNWREILTHQ